MEKKKGKRLKRFSLVAKSLAPNDAAVSEGQMNQNKYPGPDTQRREYRGMSSD